VLAPNADGYKLGGRHAEQMLDGPTFAHDHIFTTLRWPYVWVPQEIIPASCYDIISTL